MLARLHGMALSGIDAFRVSFDPDFDDAGALEKIAAEINGLRTIEYPSSIEEYAATMTKETDPETATKDFVFLWAMPQEDAGTGVAISGMVKASHREKYFEIREKIGDIVARHVSDASSYDIVFGNPQWVGDGFEDGIFPATVNDDAVVARFSPTVTKMLGEGNLVPVYSGGPFNAEDFALFLNRTPGAMFWLGVANAELGIAGVPHSPDFDVDDESLVVGTKAMSAVILDALVEAGG